MVNLLGEINPIYTNHIEFLKKRKIFNENDKLKNEDYLCAIFYTLLNNI